MKLTMRQLLAALHLLQAAYGPDARWAEVQKLLTTRGRR